ncbi:MAG: adenylate/guanylate cyclase domain-containing protein, partial [Deltaproteobacteria bacterium]|nr:adenylate/guanylate cyclase domain-containing protein [Deltaproteobacteria bacterium]
RFPLTEFMELKLYDLKFRYRGPRPAGGEVVIVAIDDASLREVGRWPWSREVLARLVARLKEAQARVIALDIIFAEREITAGVEAVRRLRQTLAATGLLTPQIAALVEQEEQRADVDRQLAQTIARGTPTVLGFYFRDVGGRAIGAEPRQFMGPKAIAAGTYNLVRLRDRQRRLPLLGARDAEVNLPEMTEAAAGSGYFNMVPDPDGSVRWLPMAIAYGPDIYAPLVLVTLRHYRGRPPLGITLGQGGVEEIRLGRQIIPVDRFGRFYLNFLGPPGAFPTYSAAAVLAGRLPPGALKDKIVLVGATAVGIYDLRVTPFSGLSPGIEIQATALDNILRRQFLQVPRLRDFPVAAVVLLLGVILGLALPRWSAAWGFALAAVLGLGYLGFNYFLFLQGWQLELFYPLAEIAGVYTGVTVLRFLAEEKARLRLKRAFQSYLAPAVVEEIIRHPERLRLGGERRELTILFCDIRGFTTLAETMEPEALVQVLHDFLNPMSEIIVNHGGTLDKYMGDAIMALFGAPLVMEDHAARACRTALQMVATLRRLDQDWEASGRPCLSLGVGLNTGVVAVGNMGSDRLFDYTAVGDNVNLASRLEGLNKFYGTEILISESCARALGEGFILQEVDLVQVKGKKQPLAVFELLGEGPPEPALAEFLAAYHEGLELFRSRQWDRSAEALARAARLKPQNPHVQRYLRLTEDFRAHPPGPDWQGVTVMAEK